LIRDLRRFVPVVPDPEDTDLPPGSHGKRINSASDLQHAPPLSFLRKKQPE